MQFLEKGQDIVHPFLIFPTCRDCAHILDCRLQLLKEDNVALDAAAFLKLWGEIVIHTIQKFVILFASSGDLLDTVLNNHGVEFSIFRLTA